MKNGENDARAEIERPLRDIHPAIVSLPDGTRLQRTRIRIYPDRLDVWEAVGRTPTLTHTLTVTALDLIDPAHPNAGAVHTITTSEGTATVSRQLGSCGCHSPLASMR